MTTRAIGTLGTIDTLTIGGRQIVGGITTPSTTMLTLIGQINGSTNSNTTLRLLNGTTGYQVTTGKTLYILAGQILLASGTAGAYLSMGYADNDVGQSSNSVFTNAVWMGNNKDTALIGFLNAAQYESFALGNGFQVPALKYPMVATNGSATMVGSIMAFGYEV